VQELDRLKRNKRENQEERARLKARMEEDKRERADKLVQQQLAREGAASASTSAPSTSAPATGATSVLSLRTEDGALRNAFPADATLLDVRLWLADEQRRRDSAGPPAAASQSGGTVGGGHVLVSNEMVELARAGRENFEKQTARMREEARALRAGPEGEAPAARGDIYFVSLLPRAEFLTEEAMSTTLREAGLVPSGTLMVRQPARAPPPPPLPDAAMGAEGEDDDMAEGEYDEPEEDEGDEEGEEEDEEEEDEDGPPFGHGRGRGLMAGMVPAHLLPGRGGRAGGRGRGGVLGRAGGGPLQPGGVQMPTGPGRTLGSSSDTPAEAPADAADAADASADAEAAPAVAEAAEAVAMTPQQRRQAALEAAMARCAAPSQPAAAAPVETAAAPAAEASEPPASDAPSAAALAAAARARREAALAAAEARFGAPAAVPTPAPAPAPPAQAPPPAEAPAPTPPAPRSAEADAARERALAAVQARTAAAEAAAGPGGVRGPKARETMAQRYAKAHGQAVPGSAPAPAPASSGVPVGVDSAERQARYEQAKADAKAKAEEKEQINARLQEDRRDKAMRKALLAGAAPPAAPAAGPSGASSSGGGAAAAAAEHKTSELRIKCEDGTVLRQTIGADETVAAAFALVQANRDAADGPFVLVTPLPRREFGTEVELQTTLREAQLVPRGTLVVLSERNRGVVRLGESVQHAHMQQHLQQLQNMLSELQAANPGEDAGYEELLEWEASMGGSVSTGLSAEELTKLKARTLSTTADDGDAQCCICCCDFVEGDKLMTLSCGHEFHYECVATWLRAKRVCPMCKATVGSGGPSVLGASAMVEDDDE